MCNMTQFVASVTLVHVNSAEVAGSFMEGVLLNFVLCIVIVVYDDSKFIALFKVMTKSLNIQLHRVSKSNHKAIGVERYCKFLNHKAKIISSTRETHKCVVEVGHISAYAWNTIHIDGTDIIR